MDPQIRRLGIVLMALFVALFIQLNNIQVLQADKLADDPRNTRNATRDFSRDRGQVLSADGAVLARSVPTDGPFERLRQYPEHDLFAHVTGYFSFTFGSDGVERTYNNVLAGRDMEIRRLRDILTDRVIVNDVTLTITKRVQQVARDALGDRKGAVVALDPTTGAVLALWSFPSYDPERLSAHDQQAVQQAWDELTADPDRPMLPRTYRRAYPPGSTFKVVTSAAALERAPELVTKDYPRLRALDLPQTNKDLPNFGGSTCGGPLPQLLRVSCNTGYAQMGLDLGADKLSGEAHEFGFGQRPPFDLPAVARSVFPEAEEFERDLPGLAQSAIGQQNVAATPLEMALVAAGVANGGKIMKPHVLADVRDSEGNVVRTAQPGEWLTATSPEAAAALRDMMVAVVNGGTATRAAVPGVQVAAKTGTAQTTGDNSHAWIVAFAPAEAPRVAVAVIVESQPGLGDTVTGGRIAAPIARAVIQAALAGP
ncbi:MAG TPA: penicillin-binding transpeptidase domain-containing protein [Acidimicrobiales bacterium]|nr:penicillin-binding transpeptidase domain-containing protein [Acidimicrobiales bacterium]